MLLRLLQRRPLWSCPARVKANARAKAANSEVICVSAVREELWAGGGSSISLCQPQLLDHAKAVHAFMLKLGLPVMKLFQGKGKGKRKSAVEIPALGIAAIGIPASSIERQEGLGAK